MILFLRILSSIGWFLLGYALAGVLGRFFFRRFGAVMHTVETECNCGYVAVSKTAKRSYAKILWHLRWHCTQPNAKLPLIKNLIKLLFWKAPNQ